MQIMRKIKVNRKSKSEWIRIVLHSFDRSSRYRSFFFLYFLLISTDYFCWHVSCNCLILSKLHLKKKHQKKNPLILTWSMTSLRGFPTFCSTVSANENSGADGAGSAFVDAADVAVSGVFILSFLLFCSFSPCWPFGRTRNWFDKTTCKLPCDTRVKKKKKKKRRKFF